VQNTLQSKDVDDASAVKRFKAQVAGLGEEVEVSLVDELAAKFAIASSSDKSAVRISVGYELHKVKIDLSNAIVKFEEANKAAGVHEALRFRTWLASMKESYEMWLARL